MSTALDDHLRQMVANTDHLYGAWVETRARLAEDGSLFGEGRKIEEDLGATLRRLSAGLLDGSWVPSPLRRVAVPKGDGEERVLRIPPVIDRIIERSLLNVVAPVIDPLLSPWSFAYRPGVGVADALTALAAMRDDGLRHVVRTDFEQCFDRIDRTRLLERLGEEIPSSWLVGLIKQLTMRPDEGRPKFVPDGIPQGSSLSPLLSNLFLDEFDELISVEGIAMVRFADDITLAATDPEGAAEAAATAAELAARIGMQINDDKTSVTTFEEGFAFLGEEIGPTHPIAELGASASGELLRKTLYVIRPDTNVTVASGQFVVKTYSGEMLLQAPISMVGHLVLCGPIGLSAGARAMALREGIEVTILSLRGRWLGRLEGGQPRRAAVRRQQYRAGDDPKRRLELARGFVVGKIDNMRALLMRYRRRTAVPLLVGATNQLREHRRSALRTSSLEKLRGIEGAATKAYFGAFALLLPEDAGFAGRTRRPPKDPANAAMSYGYAVLQGEITSAVALVGLDPVAGFLHLDHETRPSMALDLMEEFRPLIVDAVVVDLFRRSALDLEDFRDEGSGGVRLTDQGRRRLLEGLERRMLTVFHHVPSDKRVTYRRAFALQAQHFVNALMGHAESYRAVPWR